ncbi:MAG: hypothetical protein GC152_09940 [Alphaproteobacteria bacterium]|nr:hypothetical protein [Alphaproteobacteria bacterium]
MAAGLRASLSAFDRRSPARLTEAEARFGNHPSYFDVLIDCLADEAPAVSAGASWLIRHSLERGAEIDADGTSRLIGKLPQVATWDGALHLLQSMRRLRLAPADIDKAAAWAMPHLDHERPFVRAWALDALCALAEREPRLHANAARRLTAAAKDPAASVRARARRLSMGPKRGKPA